VSALASFHVWLLVTQFGTGTISDPDVAFRWVAGALILTGFALLRRLGIPLLWGRRAVVLWLFVVLLHLHAFGSPTDWAAEMSAIPEAVTAVAARVALGPICAALGLLLLVRQAQRRGSELRSPRLLPIRVAVLGAPAKGYLPQSSIRPPPA
jgi:hypothetical protein